MVPAQLQRVATEVIDQPLNNQIASLPFEEEIAPLSDPGVAHWDELAPRFDDEVFDAVRDSSNRCTLIEIKRAAAKRGALVDFGCGTGRHMGMFSSLFDNVVGIEQSPACLEIARQRCAGLSNVSLLVGTRTPRSMRHSFDVVFCSNVAIHPMRAQWRGVLISVAGLLRPGGRLVLVVPSAESARLVDSRTPSDGRTPAELREQWSQGIYDVGGVATKHFEKDELRRALRYAGLRVMRIRPNEYSWSSHGLTAPRASKSIRPWDWVAVATAETHVENNGTDGNPRKSQTTLS
jgi:SAM-dependent methyltransferase